MQPEHFESLYPPNAWFNETEKILSYVKAGNSVQLVSLPGVGRSNIMGLLAFNRKARELHLKSEESKYHFLIANFSEVKKRPLKDLNKFLLLELMNSFQDRRFTVEYKKLEEILSGLEKLDDELLVLQGLKKAIDFLCIERGLTIVFMMDRISDYLPQLDSQFFSNLRVLRDRAKYKFSVVIPLNRPLEELLEPEIYTDFYEFIVGNIVYLPITDEKTLSFRLAFLENLQKKKVKPEIKNQIVELTGGHGKLARICIEAFLSDDSSQDLITFLLRKNRVKGVLKEIWDSFTLYEQELIARNKISESSSLVSLGLLENNKRAIPLLSSYAKTEVQSDNANIKMTEGGEIYIGTRVVSDQLTSLEYKLLRYLFENGNKILERTQIIEAVWGDIGLTAGISDQALDQLIFRLRKKIEPDPNKPSRIQTVKGRGLKFLP